MKNSQNLKIARIYEDKSLLVVNKPAGLMAHSTVLSQESTLADWVVRNYPETAEVGDPGAFRNGKNTRPGLVHRLDRETSGVMIVAKTQKAFGYLKSLFGSGEVEKTYLALVRGRVAAPGRVDRPIGLRNGSIKRSVHARRLKMVKEAITEYAPVKTIEKDGEIFTLLRVYPKTGRTHQIRVHLSSIGHPVVGDGLYGKRINPWELDRQFLHAESLEFTGADGKRMKFEAELPEDLRKIIN